MHTPPSLSSALLREPLGVLRCAGALPSWRWSVGTGEGNGRRGQLNKDPRLPTQAGTTHAQCASARQGRSGPAACGSSAPVLGRVRGQLGLPGRASPLCPQDFPACAEWQRWWPESDTERPPCPLHLSPGPWGVAIPHPQPSALPVAAWWSAPSSLSILQRGHFASTVLSLYPKANSGAV